MKKLLKTMMLMAAAVPGLAQDQNNQTGQAAQSANLVMSNAIEITFSGTGSG